MKTLFYCCLLYSLSIYATCNKRFDCSQTTYSFEAFYKAYPALDSIRIRDTLWIELNTSVQLNDLIQNQTIVYSDAENFGTAIGYVLITGGDLLNPGVTPAANNFDNVLIKGMQLQSINPIQVREFLFVEENGSYNFKLGIVPKEKGLFMISVGNSTNVYTAKNKCDKANFSLTFKDTNQHLYLYEQSRPGYVLTSSDRGHLYVFKVY